MRQGIFLQRRLFLLRTLVTSCFLLALAAGAGTALAETPEDRLSGVFQAIESNQLDAALKRVEELIRDPNLRLAQLVGGHVRHASRQAPWTWRSSFRAHKHSFWVKEAGTWKIIYEGKA